MNVLLINPRCPETFWSFQYALKFIRKKASSPPLGLLTVAALLPKEWQKRVVDINVELLLDKDLLWADLVMIGAMSIQRESAHEVIQRCLDHRKPMVAGGPLFTAHYDEFPMVDYLVLNEAEITLPLFLDDWAKGTPKPLYQTTEFADIETTPIPLWNLIKINKYATMNVQYSRGCPYDCHFCDITVLYGRKPRTKTSAQFLSELDALYDAGWRRNVFLVDDNFIGNKGKIKREILPALIRWMKQHQHPFVFSTEASLNLADDVELMKQMVEASFNTVFVGIESSNPDSLIECDKTTNKNRDLEQSIQRIQENGLQVMGGFIVGFDSDPPSIFTETAKFIQDNGIVTAMVGLLNAPKGTKLHKTLLSEGRILDKISGNNTDGSLNFIPKMDLQQLLEGYRHLLQRIYTPKIYYKRIRTLIRTFPPHTRGGVKIQFPEVHALFRSILVLGIVGKERFQYWKLLIWSLFRRPAFLPLSITLAIYGYHFRKVSEFAVSHSANSQVV